MEKMTVDEVQEVLNERPDVVELLETAKDATHDEIAKTVEVLAGNSEKGGSL